MNRKKISLNLHFVAVLALLTLGSAQELQSACPNAFCSYLPWVALPAPVRIDRAIFDRGKVLSNRVHGAVITTSESPVYDISLEARFYGQEGELIALSSGTTIFAATLPGQLNPFVIFPDSEFISDPSIAHGEVFIIGWNLQSDQVFVPVTAVLTNKVSDDFLTEFTVDLVNDYPVLLADVQILIWSNYSAIGFNSTGVHKVADFLAPGDTISYSGGLGYFSDNDPFEITAQAKIFP